MNNQSDSEMGVYYAKQDYASLSKRIISGGIDFFVFLIFLLLVEMVWSVFFGPPDHNLVSEYGLLAPAISSPGYFWLCIVTAYGYLAVLKRSPVRTIGYRVAKIKIVNMKGERPSLWQMTWRFLLLAFGPVNVLADVFWLGGDDDRQALRDKMARNYVVGAEALPAGSGQLIYANYNFLCFSFLFREVKRLEAVKDM